MRRDLRDELDERRGAGARFSLQETVAALVPLITELQERHAKGERFFVYPEAIELGTTGGGRLDATTAGIMPTAQRDIACLPPEQRAGDRGGPPSSVFAIGAILYEMLTNASVGPGMVRPSDAVGELPASIDVLLSKALVGETQHRPSDLAALAQALHHSCPRASLPPPEAGMLARDSIVDFDIDVSLSLLPPSPEEFERMKQAGRVSLPPESIPMSIGAPSVASLASGPGIPSAPSSTPTSAAKGTTAWLAEVKAALESDPRPRYVVVREGMDHGPFTAVELLQQIATGSFTGEQDLRDTLTSEQRPIADWEQFEPFATHAARNRAVESERMQLEVGVAAEQQRTRVTTFAVAAVLILVVAAGAGWWYRQRAQEQATLTVTGDRAQSVDVEGGLKSGQKGRGRGRWKGGGNRGGAAPPGGGTRPVLAGGLSCEGARSQYVEQYNFGSGDKKVAPDLTSGAFQAVLGRGTYLNACGVPPSMTINICAAVQNGRAVGVTVSTKPVNGGISRCVSGQVRSMSFPGHPRLDITYTTFKGE
ncbi:MAG: hypothetical protein VB934_03465 [Polyangiaceae bacterium]